MKKIIGSHNSMSYLPPMNKWLKPINWLFAKCQNDLFMTGIVLIAYSLLNNQKGGGQMLINKLRNFTNKAHNVGNMNWSDFFQTIVSDEDMLKESTYNKCIKYYK